MGVIVPLQPLFSLTSRRPCLFRAFADTLSRAPAKSKAVERESESDYSEYESDFETYEGEDLQEVHQHRLKQLSNLEGAADAGWGRA